MKRAMLTILVLVSGSAAAAAAGFDLPHGKWWENERVAERVGLSDEQQRAIGDLVYDHMMRVIDLNAGVKKAELELAEAVEREPFDAGAVRKAFAAFQAAKSRLESERFEMLLAVRGQLTTAQWTELLEIRRHLDRLRENRRPGDGTPGRRQPQRPPGGGPRQPADGGWQ